jgi:hypothetical protein
MTSSFYPTALALLRYSTSPAVLFLFLLSAIAHHPAFCYPFFLRLGSMELEMDCHQVFVSIGRYTFFLGVWERLLPVRSGLS